ncbi:UDP-N-acetylmuramate dehydrogenase [Stutzerimonas xanthomarina]|uniref:UDP-N-acetylenolpyruvoylglucosamine reductase n=2 Tax=Stutzerimonas xanthomarina TaxID=271420 RepID=A0A1M5PCI2_9GAMM|nr:UDP-N-acetylmuramate dehydrogenase [Stutzerimonas xanthomarina]MCP9338023.1 UDP-N-acetylmuramate dehydrogenase [Stutzerimonas xanthomarina]SEH76101.1 UDP-N-acetylmuramate dehydrogenase [Stutzerimonas xanthomarina]SHG99437.1 UDP-N-acetylmuramate dehydrogenase [Stutzerimonas xanthomarina DSM 18231]
MSLHIEQRRSLKAFNTFAVESHAAYFAEAHDDQAVIEAIHEARRLDVPLWILGGGSNLVLTGNLDALVLHMTSRGIRIPEDDGQRVVIEAEAGEPWHPFVLRSLELGLAGLENLSLIPGTVGAAPIQNVGAYGVEIKDVFAGLTALDRQTGNLVEFDLASCEFAYRDSLFKRNAGRYVILRVRFVLRRTAALSLEYGPLGHWLQQHDIQSPTAMDVSRAVCSIRSEKLPDPQVLGNAGSFFKNPLIPQSTANALLARYPDLVAFPQGDGQVKLAAGWLIERAGWKGYREGDVGVHRLQALVLVNYGQASGRQILQLAEKIQADILERFGVQLEIEPNVV